MRTAASGLKRFAFSSLWTLILVSGYSRHSAPPAALVGGAPYSEPMNDMPGFGVYRRYRFNHGPRLASLAIDTSTFDVERPGEMIDILTAALTDAQVDTTTVTLWGEYECEPLADDGFFRGVRPYVDAGVGIASVGDDEVTGPTAAGGTFNFEVDGGTEIVPGVLTACASTCIATRSSTWGSAWATTLRRWR